MDKDLSKIIELINSVKTTAKCNEVELIGDKESFNKLVESGFPLENYKHQELQFVDDEPRIIIIPYEPRPIKLYFDGNET